MAKIVEYSNSKGKLYRFRVYAGIDETTGKKKYIKRSGFKTKAQAKKELVKLEYEIANVGHFKPVEVRKFRDVYDLWIEQYRLTVKESTFYMVQSYFKSRILPTLGAYNIDDLTLATCQRAVNQWYKTRPATFNILVVYASKVVEYAIKLDLTSINNFKRVTKPRRKRKSNDHNFLDADQLKKFLSLAEKKSLLRYTTFRLLAYSGMRIGELLALTWDDVNFADNTIDVNKTVSMDAKGYKNTQSPKTRGSKRLLDMDVETMQILKRWKVQQASYLLKRGINALAKSQAVFTNPQNEPVTSVTVRTWCNGFLKAGNLPHITLHGFRHTHATLLFSAGASVKEVQNRLGHSDVTTTLNIYTHLTRQDQKETIQKLVRFLG